MFDIRIHAGGSHGVGTAVELLAVAAFRDGHRAQASQNYAVRLIEGAEGYAFNDAMEPDRP